MKTSIKSTLILSFYLVGILLGMSLAGMATWADFEAAFYGFSKRAQVPFSGLSCPILMTRDETQTVYVKFTNTSGQPVTPSIQTEISTTLEPDAKLEFFDLAPGKALQIERTISAENIDLGRFIFVKALVFSAYPISDQENTCGVYVLSIHGNGTVILILASMISVISITAGSFLLSRGSLSVKRMRPLFFIAAVTILAMFFSFLGWWIQASLMLVLVILTIFITVSILIRG